MVIIILLLTIVALGIVYVLFESITEPQREEMNQPITNGTCYIEEHQNSYKVVLQMSDGIRGLVKSYDYDVNDPDDKEFAYYNAIELLDKINEK